jgi:hypothetical protein
VPRLCHSVWLFENDLRQLAGPQTHGRADAQVGIHLASRYFLASPTTTSRARSPGELYLEHERLVQPIVEETARGQHSR